MVMYNISNVQHGIFIGKASFVLLHTLVIKLQAPCIGVAVCMQAANETHDLVKPYKIG